MSDASPAVPVIDASAWVGTYPFRHIARSEPTDLADRAERLGIERLVVSAFENLFWQNGLAAVPIWVDRLADQARLEYWPVVNPAHPGELRRLAPLLDRFGPRGLRLVPWYHGYSLWDPAVVRLMDLARERGLVVQVFARIADERWHWLLKVPARNVGDQLDYFTSRFVGDRVLLSALNGPELQALAGRLTAQPGLYADLSRLRGPLFAVEHLTRTVPPAKLVFGSLWPIQIIEATLWQVTWVELPSSTTRCVLHDSFQTLLREREPTSGQNGASGTASSDVGS